MRSEESAVFKIEKYPACLLRGGHSGVFKASKL
jgi:hypothetical protein